VARLGRPGGLSAAGKKELWERWRAGESISDIARALQNAPGSIHRMIEATGGFSPPKRHRRRRALTPSEREEISRGLAAGESLRAIAARLGQFASTVCREVNRNGGRRSLPVAGPATLRHVDSLPGGLPPNSWVSTRAVLPRI
jgi:IS30 family transposase